MARTAEYMARNANRHRGDVAIVVSGHAWLSTEHLKIPPPLSCKLAAQYVGPFLVVHAIGPVSFQLQLPEDWAIHNMFYASQLKPAIGVTSPSTSPFRLAADESGEFEVDDILDSRTISVRGHPMEQFLVKWTGYSIFESTWEPRANLTNCPDILRAYLQRRGRRSSRRGE